FVPLVLSLMLAVGVLLVYLSATSGAKTAKGPPRESLADRLEEFMGQAGVEGVPTRDFLLLSVGAGAATAVVAQLALGWPVVTAAAFLIGLALPAWYFRQRREARRAVLQAALADAVDVLRAAVRAGMSVEEGLASLARSGPEPLRPALGELVRDLRLGGLEEGVRRAQERLADPVFDTGAAALIMSHRVGGRNLTAVLEGLGRSVRQAVQVQREVQAQQAKNVLSARIVAALPVVLIFAVRGINPGYLDVFSSPVGQALLALCLMSVAVGYAGMLWATRLPGNERVLRWR
ncbi:MAG: type II secretion system F family protein, partial [Dehalococcoidia bacterium]|nr:type II secretion system F family protein [Dehalococcoidia bacterium]